MMLIDICEPGQSASAHQTSASVGIDLGTTNSLVAISNAGIREVICDENGKQILPSIVSYEDDGKVIVGDAALNNPHFVRSVKRLMGRGIADVKKIAGNLPFKIVAGDDAMVTLDINGKHVTPIEVSAEILKSLKLRAEKELDNQVDKAVITVPAYFDAAARQATKDAAKLAGLEVLRLVNEPTAAALAYGLDQAAEGIYIVYDLGGGTFDVSILKMEKGVFQVLATGGDAALGGDDFDHVIAEYFIEEYDLKDIDIKQLITLSRQAKEDLTDNDEVDVIEPVSSVKMTLTREKLEELIAPLVTSTIEIIENVLVDSKVRRDEIKGVVLVGGSTRVPLVRKQVEKFLGQEPLTDVNPDLVVAIGAAVQAESLTQGSNNLLLDVTPLSLGLETMGGLVEVLIPRNTTIPTSVSQKFTTYKDNQTGLKVHIVQGEREMVFQNRSLANFELKGIPPMQAGAAVIEVTFTLDADGMLIVGAKEETTGVAQEVEIKPSYGLAPEKVEQMLRDSMEHAREDITARLLAEARVEADISINGVVSAMAKDGDLISDEYRKSIDNQLLVVEKLKKSDDRDGLDYEVQKLDKICSEFAELRINLAVGTFLEGKSVNEINKKVS